MEPQLLNQLLVGPPLDSLSYEIPLGWSDKMLDGRLKGITDCDNKRGIPVDPMEHQMECQMAYWIVVQVIAVNKENLEQRGNLKGNIAGCSRCPINPPQTQ